MKSKNKVLHSLEKFKENELIFASKLYREELSENISEEAYYKTLERMCKAGKLFKIAKGTYYLPKIGKYGVVPPSEKEIVQEFTSNSMGTIVGYYLYNALGLTTQISKNINVLSAKTENATKTIKNVVVHYYPIKYTQVVTSMIHALDVLENFYKIQDLNYKAFLTYINNFARDYKEENFEYVISKINYKKSTIAFLKEVLEYYHVSNNLYKYLSALSKYKHPKMEQLYEITRV